MGDRSPLTESFVFGSSPGTAALGLNPDSPGLSRHRVGPREPLPQASAPGGWRLGQNLGLWSAQLISDFITLQMLVNCLQHASPAGISVHRMPSWVQRKPRPESPLPGPFPVPQSVLGGLLGARPSPFPLAFAPSRSLPAGLTPHSSVLLARLVPPSPPRVGDRWREKEGEAGGGVQCGGTFSEAGRGWGVRR